MYRDNAKSVVRRNANVGEAVCGNSDCRSRAAQADSGAGNDVTVGASGQSSLEPHVHVLTKLTVECDEAAVSARKCDHVVLVVPPVLNSCAADCVAEADLKELKLNI